MSRPPPVGARWARAQAVPHAATGRPALPGCPPQPLQSGPLLEAAAVAVAAAAAEEEEEEEVGEVSPVFAWFVDTSRLVSTVLSAPRFGGTVVRSCGPFHACASAHN